jgi:hypothetical protein
VQQPANNPPARVVIIQAQPPAATAGQATILTGNAPSVAYAAQTSTAQLPFGAGLTRSETLARNVEMARANGVGQAQDFKPADDSPNRMYWCRELNNEYTLRNRRTIDQIGCRWYMTPDGSFYAVKLP